MFNFKKAICIIKKSVSVMMSAVLCLNLCLFFVYATGDDDLAKVGILGDDNSGKDYLLDKLCEVGELWRKYYNYPPKLSTKDFYDDLSDIDLVLLAVPYNGGNKKENYVEYLHRYLYRLQEAKYRGKVTIALTKLDSLPDAYINTVRTAVSNVLDRTSRKYTLPFSSGSRYTGDVANIGCLYENLQYFQRYSLKKQRKRLRKPLKKMSPWLPSSLSEYCKDLGYDEPAPSDSLNERSNERPPEQAPQGAEENIGTPEDLSPSSETDGSGSAPEVPAEGSGTPETGFGTEMFGRENRVRHLTNGQIAGIGAVGAAVIGVGVAAFTLFNKLTHHK